jgi:hypothetical protein
MVLILANRSRQALDRTTQRRREATHG